MADDIPQRPIPLPVKFDNIPSELCHHDQWVLWRYEWKGGNNGNPGKWDKPPYTPGGKYASATNPHTWSSLDRVRTAYIQGQSISVDNKKHFDGIGYVTSKDDQSDLQLTLIDLDHCRDSNNSEIDGLAKAIIDLIDSYTEISPSGTGIRIVARGRLLQNDGKGRKNGPIEIYQTGHYLTITGNRLEDYPATIETRSDAVERFYNEYFGQSGAKKGKSQLVNTLDSKSDLSDDEIISMATNAVNGDKFKKLMDGDSSGYKSPSEADAALCCIIAFYTREEAQIERIWGQSGLSRREKFRRNDYRELTIRKALEIVKEHYSRYGPEADQPTCKDKAKRSIPNKLLELAKNYDCELWHTPDNEPYISFTLNGHRENHPLKSKAVKRWLGLLLYKEEGKTARAQAMQDAINILEAQAIYEGPEYVAYIRVGEHNGVIYIDLCDNKWRALKIDNSGWKVVDLPPIRFMRSKGMLPLPEPVRNGSLEELKPLLNITDEKTWICVKAVMVGALHPSGPYPVVIFGGEQGSAKSTIQKIIRNLIDPNEAPLRRPPKDERDLMIAAKNSWIISFDNLSGIRNDLSDALCSLSTGGALTTRELYSDTEETLLSARRPVFLNGIDSIPSRHDLLDRALIITLTPLKEEDRKTEKEIMDEFNRIQPRVLGALYNAVSLGLKNLPTTQLAKKPRMADFAKWVTACEEGLDCKSGSFLEAYARAVDEANLDTISADTLAQTIINIAKYNRPTWSGTASQLLDKINKINGYDYHRPPKVWPQTGSGLSNKLNRLAPALRKMNIRIESKRTSDARIITIKEGNDGMTANDDGGNEGRHKENQMQETLVTAINRHNDGDDGVFSPLISEEKEKDGMTSVISNEKVGEKDRHCRHGVICGVDDSESDMTATSQGRVIQSPNSVMPLEGRTSIDAELQLGEQRKQEWEEHFKTPKSKKSAICPICGDNIGPGYSSSTIEGVNYCTSCSTHFWAVRASVKNLPKKNNGLGPTTSEVFEDVAGRSNRPPKREYLPAMLKAIGAIEADGRWILPGTKKDDRPHEKELTTTTTTVESDEYENSEVTNGESTLLVRLKDLVAQYESAKKNIIPAELAKVLGLEDSLSWVTDQLRALNYGLIYEKDHVSNLYIWKKLDEHR